MPEDAKLATALKAARTAPKDAPLFFALVIKGGADGALFVGKTKPTGKDIGQLKTRSGGSAVQIGRCFGEDGKIIFEMAKMPPGTMAKVLKTVMARDGGMTATAIARQAPDMVDEAIPSDVGQEAESSTTEEETEGAGSPADELTARGKKLLADSQSGSADLKNKVKLAVSQAVLFIRKDELENAKALLDKAEELLKHPGTESPTQHTAPPEQPTGPWHTARTKVVNEIHKIAAFVAKTKDPQGIPVVMGLESIVKNLPAAIDSPQKIVEVERYLREDDVVAAAEEVPASVGTLKIREPLMAVLAELKKE